MKQDTVMPGIFTQNEGHHTVGHLARVAAKYTPAARAALATRVSAEDWTAFQKGFCPFGGAKVNPPKEMISVGGYHPDSYEVYEEGGFTFIETIFDWDNCNGDTPYGGFFVAR